MITAIDLTKLRNAEYLQLMIDVLKLVFQNNPTALKVLDEYDGLQASTTAIESIFKTEQSSPLTPIIEGLDIRRDDAIMGIFTSIVANTYHFDPAVRNAANVLAEYIGIYGSANDVAKLNLQAETATVKSIVTDMETRTDLVAAVSTLSLAPWVAELKTANLLLGDKYIERTTELAGASTDNIKQKRIECNTAYYSLRDMLQSYSIITKGAAPYPKTISEINALIDQYNIIITKRATEPSSDTDTKTNEPK
jgi:Family of unknown function (DUF6261)